MKIILLASATAGHLLPAIKVYEEYKSKGNDVYLLAEDKPIPRMVLKDITSVIYIEPISSFKTYCNALKQLIKFNKDTLVISFGGRVSTLIPGLYLKGFRNLYIYELNKVMGRSNILAKPFSKLTFSYFPLKEKDKKICAIGHPLEDERKYNNIRQYGKRILVLTGSNGSNELFKVFDELKIRYPKLDLTISLGKLTYDFKSNIKTIGFIKSWMYQSYDLIIARSGAGTICDCLRLNMPVLFLPSKYVKDNHQEENAKYLARTIGIKYLMPKDYHKLYETILSEIKYERRKELVSRYKNFQHQNVFLNMNRLINNEKVI